MFISLGLSGVIPVVHGIWTDGFQALQDRMSVGLVMLHGAMYIFGAVLYAVSGTLLQTSVETDNCRFVGLKEASLARWTFGAVRIRSSTSLSSWLPLRTFMPCPRHSTTITLSWAQSVDWQLFIYSFIH